MLLILSCAEDDTVDWFEQKHLEGSGLRWLRFNTERFPEKVSLNLNPWTFTWSDSDKYFDPCNVSCVWYRKPAPSSFATPLRPVEQEYAQNEAARVLVAMQDLLQSATWVNHPERNEVVSRKLAQLRQAAEIGFTCPATLVSNDPAEIGSFTREHGGEVLVKPLHRGTVVDEGKRRAFYSTLLSVDELLRDPQSLRICPLIYQQFVKKAFELRVTVVGEECFAVRIDSQERSPTVVDWRRNPYSVHYAPFNLPGEVAGRCIRMTQQSGLLFTACDLIVTPENEYVFLEHNPNGQFAWLEQLTGVPIGRALLKTFRKSSARS